MKCHYQKKDNERCRANAMHDSDFCFTHNPAVQEQKALAVSKGGHALKKNHSILPPVVLEDKKSLISLLATTINEVRQGQADLRVADCIGYLSGHLIKAFEVADIEERLIEVERAVREN